MAGGLAHCAEKVGDTQQKLFMNSDKTEFMRFNQGGEISLLSGKCLKLVDQFIYLGSNISST